jgi:hypothetical protein
MSVPGSALLVVTLMAAAGLAIASDAQARRPDQLAALGDRCFTAPAHGAIDKVSQGPCRP